MFISAIIAAHIATGVVKANIAIKEGDVNDVFCESFVKYAQIDPDVTSEFNDKMTKMRKDHPSMLLWSTNTCTNIVKGTMYLCFGIKGFFTLIKSKKPEIHGKEYVKFIRDQHPKVKQGIVS